MNIQELYFTFKNQKKPFFSGINMSLSPGKLIALCGDNGVGKSTLLSLISGQLEAEQLEGTVALDDTTYTATKNTLPTAFTDQVRLVQQDVDTMLADQLTAHQNLQLANVVRYPTLTGLPEIDITAVQEQLPFDVDTPVHELSGGQRQLLAITMALQHNTRVLLLDEPTAALDTRNAHIVMKLLQKLAHETDTIVIMVCHDAGLVTQYADERIVLTR